MFSKALFYLFIYPLSLLPFWLLYMLSDLLYLILFRAFTYRRQVVLDNLRSSFPDKSEAEIQVIAKKFYHHLCDLMLEGIKAFSISKAELLKRYRCTNPALLEELNNKERGIILVSGHYNNWEYLVLSLDLQFKLQGVGVGKPISNKGFEATINQRRQRFGMHVIDHTMVRSYMDQSLEQKQANALMLLADQSPNDRHKCFWMRFLNQPTPVIFGPEYLAKKYKMPAVFYLVRKVKRGYYELDLRIIDAKPENSPYGHITQAHTKWLEEAILETPEFWLWSHKRWKHKQYAPEELDDEKLAAASPS